MTIRSLTLALGAALLTLSSLPARADDHGGRTALLPAYVQECGSCHTPYPPALLSAAAWQRQMNGLARHYGSDASLDATTAQTLARWLEVNAGSGRRVAAATPQDRITKGDWFVREHREVRAADWAKPAIGSPANCTACHAGAAQGRYDEHEVRIPR